MSTTRLIDSSPGILYSGEARDAKAVLERQLVRKIDLRMSMLVVILVLNYIDRSNIAIARISNLEKDLNLSATQYPTVLAIFYVGYISMMIPSNIFLHKIARPSLYLPSCAVIWGLISILTGTTKNYTGILLCRFSLGLVESSFFPGALYTLSAWYKQDELGVRSCILFCGIIVSKAFGSLMASGILHVMDGRFGFPGWRWLFFVEGSITVAIAIPAMLILPDVPETAESWLNPEEVALAKLRKFEDLKGLATNDESAVTLREALFMAFSDLKTWMFGLATAGLQFTLAFHQFFPTLVETLGYNRTITLLLCSPPSLVAAIFSFFLSRSSDISRKRFSHLALSLMLGLLGFLMALSTMNTVARYISIFLMELTPGAFVIILAWTSNSFPHPARKRAIALGFTSAFSQFGTILGLYTFPARWGPSYRKSFAMSIGGASATLIICLFIKRHLASLNRKAERGTNNTRPSIFKYMT